MSFQKEHILVTVYDEECDDGNSQDKDGCSFTCQTEYLRKGGITCTQKP